ncbi:hypothetical protein EUAN_02350 [Andreesenia angusta]|uniref:Uncharacterized protein n=1 Tax=Andreesenia angusta TaxID=39480 RepID=A0A1S1V9S5_9FIRM|nr:hypothetical protein [Andreesenia angusta]OHW63371.1 hypothetical protein EUAN_02350 [Andreesenia angusta]
MPSISKIRFSNVIYENGQKRYNDEIFRFDGHNGVVILENGGGKTVAIQVAIQAVLPHQSLAERKIRDTLMLENTTSHIAVEWIISDKPRRYALTSVNLFIDKSGVNSLKYAYEYGEGDEGSIENLPFVKESESGRKRPATKEEMGEYYQDMVKRKMNAHSFITIKEYQSYLEENFKIISSEWRKIVTINGTEGGVEAFFDSCKTTGQLVDNLLIPTVEDAILGEGAKGFADTFEKQRGHFKKYRLLRDRIEESQKVEKRIGVYVDSYRDYDQANSRTKLLKSDVKALYKFALEEEEKNGGEIEKSEALKESLKLEELELERERASCRLGVLKENMDSLKQSCRESEALKNQKEGELDLKQIRHDQLNVSKYRRYIRLEEEKLESLRSQIEKLNQDRETESIRAELEENGMAIRGYFLDMEDQLKRDIELSRKRIEELESKLEKYRKELEISESSRQEMASERSKLQGAVDEIEKNMHTMAGDILFKPDKESVEDFIPEWKGKLTSLESEMFESESYARKLNEEKSEQEEQLEKYRLEARFLADQESELSGELKVQSEAHERLLRRVKEFRTSWFNMESLYLKQESVAAQLLNRSERLREEKESLLLQERIASRWEDDYSESDYYTADPSIEVWISSWKRQFNYIESGSEYVHRASLSLGKSEVELYEAYPRWASTIVVGELELERLSEKIRERSDEISQPVFVLTELEARNWIDGRSVCSEKNVFYPNCWRDNIAAEKFEDWKRKVSFKASESRNLRKSKERELGLAEELSRDVMKFFENYPYKENLELRNQLEKIQDSRDSKASAIEESQSRLKGIDEKVARIRERSSEIVQEKSMIEGKLQKAIEYVKKKKEKKEKEFEMLRIGKEIDQLAERERASKENIEYCKDKAESLRNGLNEMETAVAVLRGKELYRETSGYSPKSTEMAIETLESERKTIKAALEDKQRDRSSLEESEREALSVLERLKADLLNFQKQMNYELEEEVEFPPYGEDELARIIDELNKLRSECENLTKAYLEVKSEKEKAENTYELRLKDFYKEFKEVVEFEIPLEQAEERIEEDARELAKKVAYNLNWLSELYRQRKDIENAVNEIKNKNYKCQYLTEEIEEVEIKEDLRNEFPYNRQKVLKSAIGAVEESTQIMEKKLYQLELEKQKFVEFCNENILDVKFKDRALSGIRKKDSLLEVLDWQSKMEHIIKRAIELAENDIRDHDREVQQFIGHLYLHLETVAKEIRQIPRNTRVKVEDSWKDIFTINVPEWNEKETKEELSRYIDWMMKQLEGEGFKDENGYEIEEKVRKSIEVWLQSKQLLEIALRSNPIKVKCRKVTNDKKISSLPYSWETSNSWSGGEKWSKNMTLFLGILNYLAEKKAGPSRGPSRTVVVDNPFGKASSDHILDPVFFIAKQLGFQIIAFTAHAEGKYIRSYFPIVYSCRLRDAESGDTQIMTKEQEIRSAFFIDKDPLTMTRLGQVEQTEIFDLEK